MNIYIRFYFDWIDTIDHISWNFICSSSLLQLPLQKKKKGTQNSADNDNFVLFIALGVNAKRVLRLIKKKKKKKRKKK